MRAFTILAFLLGAIAVVFLSGRGEGLVGFDVYFHLAVASDYAAGLGYETHIAEGVLADFSADREPVFHWLLAIPLRLGLEPETAAIIVTALGCWLFASALSFYSRSLLVALVGTFASVAFLQRMLFCRPHVLAVGLLAWGLVLLLQRRYWAAAAVNLVYTLAYSVPVVLLIVAAAEAIARRRGAGFMLVATGSLLGLIVHPHFSDNVCIMWYQGPCVLANAFQGNPLGIQMPDELASWSIPKALSDSWFFLAVMAIGAYRRTTPIWLTALQVAAFVLALTSKRFVEVFVPLVAVSAGLVITWAFAGSSVHAGWRSTGKALLFTATVVVTVTSVALTPRPIEVTRFIAVAKWLSANAEGSYVYNANWSSYPVLRYYGGNFRLAQGHDPVFLAAYDPEKYETARQAEVGQVPLEEFLDRFPADFIVAERRSGITYRYASHPAVRIVLDAAGVVVLKVDREKPGSW
jgi:hypothetical protein